MDHAADIYAALKGVAHELDEWNARPSYGRVTLGEHMTTVETPTPIPSNDCPAQVQWFDRLDTQIPHDATQTNWSAEDETGADSTAVTVNPNLDADSNDETATVVFVSGQGQFRVVATTQGASDTVRAQSVLYEITPGAPAVGTITLTPVN
jgi:hypothetical protein